MTELQQFLDMVAAEWPFDANNYPLLAHLKRVDERKYFALDRIAGHLSDHVGQLQRTVDPVMHGKPAEVDFDALHDNLWKIFREVCRAVQVLGFNAEKFVKFCRWKEQGLQNAKEAKHKKPMRERHGTRTRRG